MADAPDNVRRFLVSMKMPVAMAIDLEIEPGDEHDPAGVNARLNKKINEVLVASMPSVEIKDKQWELTQALTNKCGVSVIVIPGIMLPENTPEINAMARDFCEKLSATAEGEPGELPDIFSDDEGLEDVPDDFEDEDEFGEGDEEPVESEGEPEPPPVDELPDKLH
jgi:hypothetical protein